MASNAELAEKMATSIGVDLFIALSKAAELDIVATALSILSTMGSSIDAEKGELQLKLKERIIDELGIILQNGSLDLKKMALNELIKIQWSKSCIVPFLKKHTGIFSFIHFHW
jgi:hypothetical protein